MCPVVFYPTVLIPIMKCPGDLDDMQVCVDKKVKTPRSPEKSCLPVKNPIYQRAVKVDEQGFRFR